MSGTWYALCSEIIYKFPKIALMYDVIASVSINSILHE